MSNYPSQLDDDTTLPRVDNNITEEGGDAINALRDAVFAIEDALGINVQGAVADLATRLGIALDANGNIKASAIAGLGLITLPITDSQVSATAQIQESKLLLAYGTSFLNSKIDSLALDVQTALNFVNDNGFTLPEHIAGSAFNHYMSAIEVAPNTNNFFKNYLGLLRNNANLYSLFDDLNNDYIAHQVANGLPVSVSAGIQSGGTDPPTSFAHNASGINLNTNAFSFIPRNTTDLQALAEFLDNSNSFLLGSKIQTFWQNGISRSSRASTLTDSTKGQLIVPATSAITYLLYSGATTPVDNIDHGDDIVEFTPSATSSSNNSFDGLFAAVKVGDIITVHYPGFDVSHTVKEKKYIGTGGNKKYLVRTDGKNTMGSTSITASINRPLFNTNKFGVLAVGQAHHGISGVLPTLIVGNPRGAEVLGVGFNPDLIDSTHYNLYLNVYPDGNPQHSVAIIPAIDVSGNKGLTPGQYTLDSVVQNINDAFRTPGFNNRFMAFSYQGEIGIKMTDAINNISFSVIDGVVASSGTYDQGLSSSVYQNNVIGTPGFDSADALGFGPSGAGISGPAYSATFPSSNASQTPAKINVPLAKKNYYVNGTEREKFEIQPFMSIDGYGDAFWPATITGRNIIPGVRLETTYQVPYDLTTSNLVIGKSLTVIAGSGGSFIDSGRFFISNIQIVNNCSNPYTNIVVYDAIQSSIGLTPQPGAPIGTAVSIYFSSDSASFNIENASDQTTVSPFKRSMEVYINEDGYTFTHERGRMNISGSQFSVNGVPLFGDTELTKINIVKISPKLRGYLFSGINKINLQITSYSQTTGIFSGYLAQYDGITATNQGPTTVGKKGNIVRFYDQTNVEYIDFAFDFADSVSAINSLKTMDVQLFPTLRLDDEDLLIATVQVNTITNRLEYLKDERQFGNTSEKQFSTSAIDYIAAPTRLLSENGVVRGFDITGTSGNQISINGGVAVVNGKIVQVNQEVINIPIVQETLVPYGANIFLNTITWFLCIDDKGEFEWIASTDFDTTASSTTYDTVSLDHNRIFYALNPNDINGSAYAIRGDYLADIVLNQRDVVPLAVVVSTITSSGGIYSVSSTTTSDARRFIYNGYGGLIEPFVFGANGSFRTFTALNTWLQQLTKYKSYVSTSNNPISGSVIVKGLMDISGLTLSFPTRIKFLGDGGGFTVNTMINANNVFFQNLSFTLNDGYGINFTGSNILNNCILSYTFTGSTQVNRNMVLITSGSSLINGNKFNRNGHSINAYILEGASNTSNQIITHNFFDSATVDGSDTNLSKNLSGGSINTSNATGT